MIVNSEFIEMGLHGSVLNKAQCRILDQSYPPADGWETLVVGKELSQSNANLFLLLRGKLALSAQEQIVKNYKLLADFHKKNRERKEKSKVVATDGLTIYCDGACKGNPGKAGSGLSIYSGDAKPILYYGAYEERGTNNTAELNALHKALLISSESEASKVTICCDSKYSIDCISTWAYGWKRNGWKKKGGEIKNLAIIKQAHTLYESMKNKVTIKHVKGHAGVEGNELADRMAGYAIVSKSSEYECYDYEDVSSVLDMGKG